MWNDSKNYFTKLNARKARTAKLIPIYCPGVTISLKSKNASVVERTIDTAPKSAIVLPRSS